MNNCFPMGKEIGIINYISIDYALILWDVLESNQ